MHQRRPNGANVVCVCACDCVWNPIHISQLSVLGNDWSVFILIFLMNVHSDFTPVGACRSQGGLSEVCLLLI